MGSRKARVAHWTCEPTLIARGVSETALLLDRMHASSPLPMFMRCLRMVLNTVDGVAGGASAVDGIGSKSDAFT